MNSDIDVQIAEKIFGWRPFKKKWQAGAHAGFLDSWLDSENIEVNADLPHYSTNIADAWQVVEKMGEKNYSMSLRSDANFGGIRNWDCAFSGLYDPRTADWVRNEPSAAMAIARAALAAINKPKE